MAWMSEEQAAAALGVTFKTIRRRVGNGSLPSMRRGSNLLVNVELARVEDEKPASEEQSGLSLEPIAPVVPVVDTIERPVSPHRPPALIPAVAPKMHLAAATLNRVPQAVAPLPTPPVVTAELHTLPASSRPKPRWMELTIWALLTLLFSTGTISVWLFHDTRQRLQEADNRVTQALASTQQARLDGVRELTVFKAAAADKEQRLQAEVASARARVAELTAQVQKDQQTAADLNSALDLATSRLAAMAAQKHELSNHLAITQASLTALKWKGNLSDAMSGFVTRLRQGLAGATESASLSMARSDAATDESSTLADIGQMGGARMRELPPAAPSLAKEDLAVRLRPIVKD